MILLKTLFVWSIVLLGFINIHSQCEARAVNVSNTWTMPQEGLNVFYRFFRDRISWFEADAVCQFHHANLVTVDNSFQFDATRDLLRELDVNDIVWIGLIRPQSSERFMWSNSRPLIADTGYWAEALPLMEAPLCAVIDPIRDYRWHALRCGGPETASFLCEMAVPTWADVCIFKDIPDLTMQYMADTASVELIRTCQEEGTLRQTCKGKQDRERVQRELVCPRERMEAKRINDITNSHFKSLKIIKNVHTDNNENNNIELVPISVANYDPSGEVVEAPQATEKNTVQRLIEQFNVDELMQGDQPAGVVGLTEFKIPGQIPKPVKKIAKKYVGAVELNSKKSQLSVAKKYDDVQPESFALEDMMMGDQPQGEPELVEHVLEDEESNDIMEPLPHQKKILPQDLKSMPSEKLDDALTTTIMPQNVKQQFSMHPVEFDFTTMNENQYASEEFTTIMPKIMENNYHDESSILTGIIGHPIHPQQTHMMNINLDAYPHIKETVVDNSHFIPPMLMVKSHYVPSNKHEHEHEHVEYSEQLEPIERPEHHVHLHALPATTTIPSSSSSSIGSTTTIGSEVAITSSSMPLTTTTTTDESSSKTHLHVLPSTTESAPEGKISELDVYDKMAISRVVTNNINVSTTQSPVILSSSKTTDTSNVDTNVATIGKHLPLLSTTTMRTDTAEKNIEVFAEKDEQQMRFERRTTLPVTTEITATTTTTTTTSTSSTSTTKPISPIETQSQKEIFDILGRVKKNEQQIVMTTSALPTKIPTMVSTTTATTTTTDASSTRTNEGISTESVKESMTTSSSSSSSAAAAAEVAQLMSTTEMPDLRVSTATKVISSKRTPDIRATTSTIRPVDHDRDMIGQSGGINVEEEDNEENFEEEKYDKMLLTAAKNTDKAQEFEAKVAAAFAAASNVGQKQQQQQLKQLDILDVETTEASAESTTTTKATTAAQLISSSSELPTFLLTEEKQEKTITTTQPIIITTTTTATSTSTTAEDIAAKIITPFIHNKQQKQQQQEQHVKETAKTELKIEKSNKKSNNNNNKKKNHEFEMPSTLEGIIKISTTLATPTAIDQQKVVDVEQEQEQDVENLKTSTYRSFYVDDTTVQFRPNRKRILTKPEGLSYFKKILG